MLFLLFKFDPVFFKISTRDRKEQYKREIQSVFSLAVNADFIFAIMLLEKAKHMVF